MIYGGIAQTRHRSMARKRCAAKKHHVAAAAASKRHRQATYGRRRSVANGASGIFGIVTRGTGKASQKNGGESGVWRRENIIVSGINASHIPIIQCRTARRVRRCRSVTYVRMVLSLSCSSLSKHKARLKTAGRASSLYVCTLRGSSGASLAGTQRMIVLYLKTSRAGETAATYCAMAHRGSFHCSPHAALSLLALARARDTSALTRGAA